MPTPLLDLTHILAAEAIRQDAFVAGYRTVEELLNRPQVVGTSATVLAWKHELLERRICSMNCDNFRRTFKRLCLVAGLEKPPRPYFLRIGTGVNFEGKSPLHYYYACAALYAASNKTPDYGGL